MLHAQVKKQNIMLDDLDNKLDTVTDQLEGVNSKMKKTLEKVPCHLVCFWFLFFVLTVVLRRLEGVVTNFAWMLYAW